MSAPFHPALPPDIKPAELSRYWNQLLAPFMGADNRRASFQLVTTACMFLGTWALMWYSLRGPYWVTVLLSLPAVGLMTRLFIFQHDCGHGSFFTSRRVNNLVGSIIGVATLTPYYYWRRTHAIHHATSGDLDRRTLGDVKILTVEEYLSLRKLGRLQYRVYRNPIVLFGVGPIWQFIIKHRLPADAPRTWRKEWMSVLTTNLGLAAVVVLAHFTMGLKAFFLVQLPITLVSGVVGIWLFYIQHQFQDTYWRKHKDWDFCRAGIQGSSFYNLPRMLHWFTGNIGFHHVHHLASRIPNYNLQRCFHEIKQLHHVTRLSFRTSLKSLRLALWDEANERLVSFRSLRHRQTA